MISIQKAIFSQPWMAKKLILASSLPSYVALGNLLDVSLRLLIFNMGLLWKLI